MSTFTKIRIILTIMIGLVVAILAFNFFSDFDADTKIIVASMDIPDRTIIQSSMLTEKTVNRKWQREMVPNAFTKIKDLEGYVSNLNIPINTPIDKKLHVVSNNKINAEANKGETGSSPDTGNPQNEVSPAVFLLEEKDRMVVLRLNPESAFGNKLRKGDLVDVYGSLKVKENGVDVEKSIALKQNVEVFDVQKLGKPEDYGVSEQNILLKLPNDVAGRVIWVKNNGKIDLVLSSKRGKPTNAMTIQAQEVLNQSLGNN